MTDLATALKIALGKHHGPILGSSQFGRLVTFSKEEQDQLEALTDLIIRYVTDESTKRPLCVAIFGQPGSGKSFAAKEICGQAKEHPLIKDKIELQMTSINMTQVGDVGAVGRVLARVATDPNPGTVPILFVDEFDASRNGAPYGWLSWFLAPMHDGEFIHDGAAKHLERVVYVFAGGTAHTMEEFSAQASAEFRSAKGPDFVSRLRGYLDVQGPNQAPRAIRRAMILRSELEKRLTARDKGVKRPRIDPELLKSLLTVGRYRHGARSIAAIVEMSSNESDVWSWDNLPENHLLKLHIDRGPLDAERIRGSIALSGYSVGPNENTSRTADGRIRKARPSIVSRQKPTAEECWMVVAEALWNEGATLAYVWVPEDEHLMAALSQKLSQRPVEPKRRLSDRKKPSPWLVGYMSSRMTVQHINKIISSERRQNCGLRVDPQDPLEATEREHLHDDAWRTSIVSKFRRRFAMSEASVARFAVGGWPWPTGYKSRVPGVVEEVMLTLAFQRPVYIAGGFGGAAADLGVLLGLADVRRRTVNHSFSPNPNDDLLPSFSEKLQPPPLNDLPIKSTEIVTFLRAHAMGGTAWPNNGLSHAENRALFLSTSPEQVGELVVRGLVNWAKARPNNHGQ